jgi:hypothetical protein
MFVGRGRAWVLVGGALTDGATINPNALDVKYKS